MTLEYQPPSNAVLNSTMSSSFLLFHLTSYTAYCQPTIPPLRWFAPTSEEAFSALSCGDGVVADSVYQRGHRFKPSYVDLSGILYSTRGDSSIAEVAQFTNGKRSGTWYVLDVRERVTEVYEYAEVDSERIYRYDEQGRLEEHCSMMGHADDSFDRIFGGGGLGTCWSFDSIGRVTHKILEDTTGYFETVQYYPNGQPAQRKSHDRSSSRIEQWCPKGKRIAFAKTEKDSVAAEPRMQGTLILWSVMDYAYYAVKRTKDHCKLKKLPMGRWRSYTDKEYLGTEANLKLGWVEFIDQQRPAELPCSLRRR